MSAPFAALGLPQRSEAPDMAEPAVTIHLCRLECDDAAWAAAMDCLSEVEQARALRFIQPIHQRRFARSRHLLRQILAHYTGIAPDALNIAIGQHGRPYLAEAPRWLDFNLSHSGDWAAVAVSFDSWIGVDIEKSDRVSYAELAERVLRERELRDLYAWPEEARQRQRQFFGYWTAKEAYMKLNGLGFGIPPEAIEVAWGEGEGGIATVPAGRADLAAETAWLVRIPVDADTECTLATPVPAGAVTVGTWPAGA